MNRTMVLLTAGIALAMAFVLSCSDDGNNSDDSLSSSSAGDTSSSSNFVAVCPSFNPATHFCDSRDNKVYKYVSIGSQIWMAENLNFNPGSGASFCYAEGISGVSQDSIAKNCQTYGRLYDWRTAMNLHNENTNYNTIRYGNNACPGLTGCYNPNVLPHQGICPDGWHLPTDPEWTVLINGIGASTAGKQLKANSGWIWSTTFNTGNGDDNFGFAALPGGYGLVSNFGSEGYYGRWWTATEGTGNLAYAREMYYASNGVGNSTSHNKGDYLLSVRCVKN